MKKTIYAGMMNGLRIDRCTRDGAYNMIKHWHPEFEIQYFIKGRRHFFIEDRAFAVKPGSLVLVNSGQIHNTYSEKFIFHDRVLLLFEQEKFAPQMKTFDLDLLAFFAKNWGVIQIPQEDRVYIEHLFARLAQEAADKNFMFKAEADLLMVELFIYLARLKNSGQAETLAPQSQEINEVVQQVTHYIRKNYATVGSLDELAKLFFVDKFYLSRIFKKSTGQTITEFTNIQKIQHAQKLLEDTNDSIAQISLKVGYENKTYFDRVFKKYVETSPVRYRKKQSAYKKSLRDINDY
ncbi:helix-turn-helix domain-containing protein [Enterococcus timonensis]|uniref:helix-turn-helix domain-containing protein n=1 Tax=Enterococcus timonensis TaxID=1852364 RepID=UPI0008D8D9DF|nr:AraC family transcriptional regulator [Enterococcus timonensis]